MRRPVTAAEISPKVPVSLPRPLPTAPTRHRPRHRPAAQVRLPAQPAGRRRRPAAGRGGRRRARRARHHRRRGVRAGQAAGGGLAAGRAGPGHPVPHQRGALPAAAGARRGAPVRHHLPPPAPFEGHDRLRAGRRARAGAGPPGRAAQALRLGAQAAGRPSVDEIAALPGFGPRTAAAVLAALQADAAGTGRAPAEPVPRTPPTGCRPGEADRSPEPSGIEVALVSGLSGAGRSTAAKVLEDLGWFVVDNLPPELIATMVDLGARARGEVTRIAVVMDVRSRAFTADLGRRDQGPRRARLQAAAAVPGGDRRGAGAPVRAGAAQPPAAGRRPAGRRHRRRARAAARRCGRAPTWSSTPPRWRCRSCGPRWSARSARESAPAHPRHGGVLRLQVRAADGLRPRRRRALPAQPVLDPGAARA